MELFKRLWRGEIGLARTFWIYGFAVGFCLRLIPLLLVGLLGPNPAFVLALMVYALFLIAYQVFIAVAIWRSAGRYQGNRAWAFLAKAMVVLGILQTVLSLVGVG
ncbi:MAG: hypothetical protein H0S80_03130 [Desulfovibrionaceae bacterium]|nr:hypothetical protein [Desulfovibrionaceae bacterium]